MSATARASRRVSAAVGLAALLTIGGCAARTAPPPPAATAAGFPDFMFPAPPQALAGTVGAGEHTSAWQRLQAGDLREADRAFHRILDTTPTFFPAEAGLGYVAMARRDYKNAVSRFDRALQQSPAYASALTGRGDALLALGRDEEALASFDAAIASDDTLADVRRRADVLRLRAIQDFVAQARQAASGGRLDDARDAYTRAIGASPSSSFLYRDLAAIERRQDQLDSAEGHLKKALELDAGDARAYELLGEIHEAKGDLAGAEQAYAKSVDLEPNPAVDERLARVRAGIDLGRLPPQYRALADAPRATRGDLAALLGIRLERLLASAPRADAVVLTDVRSHWAGPWIQVVARTGVMEAFPNHTFTPGAELRRADLARATSRVLDLIAAQNPSAAQAWSGARPRINDLPPGHILYPAAAAAVAAGVLPLADGAFQPSRAVTGAEAVACLDRLAALSAPRRTR